MQHLPNLAVADAVFRLQTSPEEAVAHPGWTQARAALLASLDQGGAAVLLGLPGSGKTLLLQELARTLRREGRAVRLVGRGDALDGLQDGSVLLVDEAGRMGPHALAALCAGPAPFVLAALPGFTDRLAGLPRSVDAVTLPPLPPKDIARYAAARLVAAGQPRDLLEPEAVLALARHSGGLLRLVNTIGGAAMFLARLEGAPRVSPAHVDEAASMRGGTADDEAPLLPAGAEEAAAAPPAVLAAAPPAVVPPAVATPASLSTAEAAFTAEAAPAMPPTAPASPGRRRMLLGAAVAGLGFVAGGGGAVLWRLSRQQPVAGVSAPVPDGVAVQPSAAAAAPATASGVPATAARAEVAAPPQPAGALLAQAQPTSAGEAPAQPVPPQPASPLAAQAQSTPVPARPAPPPASSAPGPQAQPTPARPPRQADQPANPAAGNVREARSAPGITDEPVLFRGPIHNETLNQGGQVTLVIRRHASSGAVTARFDAFAGLVGSGELAGRLSESGQLAMSGQLMMGRNPFDCDLSGVIAGGRLTGTASFVRSGGGTSAFSRFSLTRA